MSVISKNTNYVPVFLFGLVLTLLCWWMQRRECGFLLFEDLIQTFVMLLVRTFLVLLLFIMWNLTTLSHQVMFSVFLFVFTNLVCRCASICPVFWLFLNLFKYVLKAATLGSERWQSNKSNRTAKSDAACVVLTFPLTKLPDSGQ